MNFALDFFGLPVATRANVIIPLLIGPPGDAAAIADGTIANAKLANVATATFKGRTTSGSGAPEDLTATQATALLNPATSSLKGLMAAADFSKLAGITSTKQTEWDTAYTQTRQWGGGATGLDATTGRASLGGTTIGSAVFTLANPGAITFPRFNADNTVTALSASDFRTAIGAGTSSTTGTVTTVSITTANGVSGSVVNANTTPAITITLGAITPTSVAATGNVTGANLSGTNTGDQTISLTGDLTGSGTGSFAVTLATVNSNTGSFGGATQVGTFTVNAKGLVTAASNVTVTPAASSITGGAALTRTNDTNVTITLGGSPGASLLAATSLTVGWSGTLAVARGGTGGGDAATARTNLGLSSIPVLLPVVAASNLAAGSTFYFGPLGPQTTNTLAPWSIAGKTGTITGFQISTGAFPGSDQTYTYTIFKNGSATAITGTITGGASNTISVTGGSVSVSGYDNFQLQLVTSAGAAATLHAGNVVLSLDI